MKSRISFCNGTALKKDVTRFAPVWVLYSVLLLMIYMICFDSDSAASTAYGYGNSTYAMAIINCCYALLTAQLLFGDLFNARMTNALHAMPLRRETWFGTHLTAGLLFSLVPNLVMALGMALFCGSEPMLPWVWLLTATAQYVFFFGLAVLCALCVGSRFAMVVVYGLVNFGSLLAWWLLDTLYVPLLYGVELVSQTFLKLSPVCYGTVNIPVEMTMRAISSDTYVLTVELLPENLAYTGILAAVGVAFGALALVLYRRRALETAGDFIAAGWMKPVFLVLYTLMMGAGFQGILGSLAGVDWLFLFIGIVVGYFTGQMLVMRTARIFTARTFAGFGVLVAALLASLGLTALDPLDITGWVPEPGRVASVTINNQETQDPELIGIITQVHQAALDNRNEDSPSGGSRYTRITYTMTDGSQISRRYLIPIGGTAHALLKPVLSSPEFVLQELPEEWETSRVTVSMSIDSGESFTVTQKDWDGLYAAILLDCQAGTMAQDSSHHEYGSDSTEHWLYFQCYDAESRSYRHYGIGVYADAANTLAWLEASGYLD